MARLYNGFDALMLGRAINDMHNGYADRTNSALRALSDSVSDYIGKRAEEEKEAARRKSAIEYLMGNGYDQQKAEQFVNVVDPSEAVRYSQSRLDKAADTADEREYEQTIHDRNRGEQISDRDAEWAHDFEDFVTKSGITYGQAVRQMQFSQLMQQLGLITSKDWGNSRKGVDQYNDTIRTLQDFAKENPEFTAILGTIKHSFDNGENKGYYDEDIKDRLRELGAKDFTDQQREEYLKELIDNDKFGYIVGNPDFSDAILKFGANVDKKNLMKQVNLQRLLGNTVTETQRVKQRQNADWVNRKKNLANMISEAYNDRTHSKAFPNLNENELAAMKEIFKKNPWVLNHYLKK